MFNAVERRGPAMGGALYSILINRLECVMSGGEGDEFMGLILLLLFRLSLQ